MKLETFTEKFDKTCEELLDQARLVLDIGGRDSIIIANTIKDQVQDLDDAFTKLIESTEEE